MKEAQKDFDKWCMEEEKRLLWEAILTQEYDDDDSF